MMKLSSFPTTFLLSIILLSLVPSSKSDLTTQWNMGDFAESSNEGNLFTFNYLGLDEDWITDMDTQVQVTMYAYPCKTGGDDEFYGQIGMVDSTFTDESPIEMNSLGYDGVTDGTLQLQFTTVPRVMANLPAITTDFGDGISEMKFCVRNGLYSGGVGGAEVNFLETQVKITVSMVDDFRFDNVNVSSKDKTSNTAVQGYQVDTVLCPDQPAVFNQGATILVCISPGADALAVGVVLKSVDTFEWTREGVPTQSALNGPNTDAENGLSVVTLQDDQLLIIIQSVIYAAFYVSAGNVLANGSASMEFASSESRRRLHVTDNDSNNNNDNNKHHRHLQDINDPSSFELNVPVLEGTGTNSSGGVGISVTAVAIIVGLVSGALLLLE